MMKYLLLVLVLAIFSFIPSVNGLSAITENVTAYGSGSTAGDGGWWAGAGSGCNPNPPDPLSPNFLVDNDFSTGSVASNGAAVVTYTWMWFNYTLNTTPYSVVWDVRDGVSRRNLTMPDDCIGTSMSLRANATDTNGAPAVYSITWQCMNLSSGKLLTVDYTGTNANICAYNAVYEERLFWNYTVNSSTSLGFGCGTSIIEGGSCVVTCSESHGASPSLILDGVVVANPYTVTDAVEGSYYFNCSFPGDGDYSASSVGSSLVVTGVCIKDFGGELVVYVVTIILLLSIGAGFVRKESGVKVIGYVLLFAALACVIWYVMNMNSLC